MKMQGRDQVDCYQYWRGYVWKKMCLEEEVSGRRCVWKRMCLEEDVYGRKLCVEESCVWKKYIHERDQVSGFGTGEASPA